MTTLKSSLSTDVRGCFAVVNGRPYFTNDLDPIQVWNPPASATADAGIDGPSGTIGAPTQGAGSNATVGDHLVRYRYINKATGYVSNPSDARTVTVTAAGTDGQLTFGVAASGDDIDRSTDSKVTHIIVEMTAVGGTIYYTAATVANSGVSSVVVDISDSSLTQQESTMVLSSAFGHEKPPLAKLLLEHRGRLFYGGATIRTRTSVTATNALTTVTGTNFSTLWSGRYIRFDSETTVYRIASVASATSLTLEDAYTGSTSSTKTITVFSRSPNRIGWSLSGYPESFKPSERERNVLNDKSDSLSGWASYAGDVWLIGQHSMERLTYATDPALGALVDVPTEHGTYNNDCLVKVSNRLYGFGRAGCWLIDGGIPTHISDPIDELVDSLIDRSQFADFHGSYDPVQRVIRWWFVESGETLPKLAIAHDVDDGHWWLDEYDVAITASRTVPDSNGNLRCILGDENGYSWFADGGKADGVASNNPVVVTATGSPTTTVIDVSETLSSSIASLAGAPVYFPKTGDVSYVASHTSSQLTLGTALSEAPVADDELYIGHFEWRIRSKWWDAGKPLALKQPLGFWIKLVPTDDLDATMKVSIFMDYSSTAMSFDIGNGSYTFDNGVTITDGGSTASFKVADAAAAADSNGLILIPLDPTYVRALQYELTMDDPRGTVRILDAGFLLGDEEVDPNE